MSEGVVYLCGGGDPVPDTTSDCPDRAKHTPMPTGYVDWHQYASRLAASGARQSRCSGCGRYEIWSGGRILGRREPGIGPE